MPPYPVYKISLHDKEYPNILRQIYDPPKELYIRGCLPNPLNAVAIVGSRKYSYYGEKVTKDISSQLTKAGTQILSGLAFGIDAIAHNACLQENGMTIAVLGSGIDDKTISPKKHYHLAQQILKQNGALVSELPPNTPAAPYTFPRRNRIIAGLAKSVIVTEARKKSGALITAQLALENGKDVLAIPHPIYSQTGKGTNALINEGAAVLYNLEDLYTLLHIDETPKKQKPYTPKNIIEKEILDKLHTTSLHINELIQSTNLPQQSITSTLLLLEIQGIVTKKPGAVYETTY